MAGVRVDVDGDEFELEICDSDYLLRYYTCRSMAMPDARSGPRRGLPTSWLWRLLRLEQHLKRSHGPKIPLVISVLFYARETHVWHTQRQ